MNELFRRFARATADAMGSSWAFIVAALIIVVWAFTGPVFHFSDTWQLVINTGTSVATFMMVFLIQNTQNRDAKAIHVKLDELLRAISEARTELVDLEDMSDDKVAELLQEFKELREEAVNNADEAEGENEPEAVGEAGNR